ncbi:hypothetical protein IL992_10345 [Microbispora sp. NEAU-D428]|uniref:hypothetical protein n=1 Tax=Microbispora sitophila TaxID=2771537 RepID=UPI001866FE3E|nr:hypothetical protein [Microbispora sitophila]MBE3009595.1 hypothetical protein [Microbispora sitophila]
MTMMAVAITIASCDVSPEMMARSSLDEAVPCSSAMCAHVEEVLTTGMMIANPEYVVEPWYGGPSVNGGEITVGVFVRPRSVPDASMQQVFEVVRKDSGEVRFPHLPYTDMAPLLFGAAPEVSHNAQVLLDRLPSNVTVTVVVELKHPMRMEELKKTTFLMSLDLILSPLRPMTRPGLDGWRTRPLYWPSGLACEERDRPQCDDTDQMSQFRSWVAALRDDDAIMIKTMGFDLSRLRSAASAGLVYGWIVYGQPEVVRPSVAGPLVKAARIADITPVRDKDQVVVPLPRSY